MYRSCLYCAGNLGRNDRLEWMSVGRRIAFNPAHGRLWVVCPNCIKWNLVPFDARLEAIDDCERAFRGARTRYSTDNIGMATLADGLDLIRIGPALRPEYASWRYGVQIRRRRRLPGARHVDAIGAFNWLLNALPGGAFSSLGIGDITRGTIRALRQHCVLRDPWTDQLVEVPYAALVQAQLTADGADHWRLEVPYRTGVERRLNVDGSLLPSIRDVPTLGLFDRDRLMPTLGRILPALDDGAARGASVREAVRLVEAAATPGRLFEYVVGKPLRFATQRAYALSDVPGEVRLAIEMMAHEDTERRAMEGELRLLERQWREAERIAAIADQLALES